MEVIRTVRAVTAPVELLEPTAVTQSPTASELAAVDSVSLKVVDPCSPIVTVVGLIDVGGVEVPVPVRAPRNPDEEMPSITMLEGLIEVTLPLANPKPLAPLGTDPAGRLGTLPPFAAAPRRNPPAPPAPPAPKRPVQLPDEEGLLTMTVLATNFPVEEDPMTVTQSPAATLAAVRLAVLVKVVAAVQLTVT